MTINNEIKNKKQKKIATIGRVGLKSFPGNKFPAPSLFVEVIYTIINLTTYLLSKLY